MKRTSLMARSVLALAMPAVLISCAGSTSPSGDSAVTSISVMDSYTETDSPHVAALNKCAAKAGVTLDRQTTPFSGYVPKVLQQASSKTLPDVLMLNDPWVAQIASIGALAPLSEYNISTDGFAQGVLAAGTYEGEVYGLLPAVATYAFFYNKDVLAKAGVKPPTTWDELKAAAAKLTSNGRYGVAFNAIATPGSTSSAFLPFVWSNGGDETNIDSPQTAEALQLWTDLVKSGSASSGVLNWSTSDVVDQFAAGKAAMMINGPWAVPILDKVSGLTYGIVKIPVKSASDPAAAGVAGKAWTITRTGNKAKQAKAAEIVGCLTGDEMQLLVAKGTNEIPSKTALAAQFGAENPKLAVFTDLLKSARARSGKLGPDWPKTETQILTAIQTAVAGKASPADALKQAKSNG